MNNIISFQSNISKTKSLISYTIEDIYDFIKTGGNWSMDIKSSTKTIQNEPDHDKQNTLKAQLLPYACFNGKFETRCESGLQEYSNYTAIDFDKFQSEDELLNIGYWLTQTPFVKFFFRSPSGKGLKAIIEHTNTDPLKHGFLYNELLQYFRIPEIDTKTSDISRATFLCYDPSAWWNNNCIAYSFDEKKYSDGVAVATPSSNHSRVIGDYEKKRQLFNSLSRPENSKITDNSIKNIIGSWIDKEKMDNNRNNSLYKYSCKLCLCGIKYDYALQLLLDKYGKIGLSEEEIKNTTCSAYYRYYDDFGKDRESMFKKK